MFEVEMTTSVSEVALAKRINSPLTFNKSSTNERNTAYPIIKEEIIKSVFYKIVEDLNSSEQMNLANSPIIEPPKLVSFGHLPMETDNVRKWLDGIVATRIEYSNRIWRRTARDDRMAHTHDDIEDISEKIPYRKHIRDLEFETREVLEQ